MMRKQKEEKAKEGILETLLRDMQGTGAEKLVLFEKLKAARGFANASPAELRKVESMLRALAAMEKQ